MNWILKGEGELASKLTWSSETCPLFLVTSLSLSLLNEIHSENLKYSRNENTEIITIIKITHWISSQNWLGDEQNVQLDMDRLWSVIEHRTV